MPLSGQLQPELIESTIAGVTMFGALKKLEKYCQRNDWVVLLGAGGGLGHL
jgi:propanol-preferring alcohol dehydrogenase